MEKFSLTLQNEKLRGEEEIRKMCNKLAALLVVGVLVFSLFPLLASAHSGDVLYALPDSYVGANENAWWTPCKLFWGKLGFKVVNVIEFEQPRADGETRVFIMERGL